MTIRQKFATFCLACALACGGVVAVDSPAASAASASSEAVAATSDQIATGAADALAAIGTDQFSSRLGEVAFAVAARLEVGPGPLLGAWLRADRSHQIALLSALTQVGVPYHRNASKVGIAFDCSGLTAFAWAQSGIELAHHSSAQLRNAAKRDISTAQAGDLVFYPGHVMIWLGVDNLIVHAERRGHPVKVDQISNRRVRHVKFADPTA